LVRFRHHGGSASTCWPAVVRVVRVLVVVAVGVLAVVAVVSVLLGCWTYRVAMQDISALPRGQRTRQWPCVQRGGLARRDRRRAATAPQATYVRRSGRR
jgi:hypothetical protein